MDENFSWLLMQQAEIMALNAGMQGMIASNQDKFSRGEPLAYDETAFVEIATQMRSVAEMISSYR